ncbi:hypothetical protein Taro_032224 [Colocasia esculenta]|uniref:Uncharacterized protein n=1 Tax=Colocasia esculenta TaxID=4460 RepID=A0A843VU85_COLES|nr:hypothetical protein [Colocasia esculenta]
MPLQAGLSRLRILFRQGCQDSGSSSGRVVRTQDPLQAGHEDNIAHWNAGQLVACTSAKESIKGQLVIANWAYRSQESIMLGTTANWAFGRAKQLGTRRQSVFKILSSSNGEIKFIEWNTAKSEQLQGKAKEEAEGGVQMTHH